METTTLAKMMNASIDRFQCTVAGHGSHCSAVSGAAGPYGRMKEKELWTQEVGTMTEEEDKV